MGYLKTKNWEKLEKKIVDEIKNILANCELYLPDEDEVYVVELPKIRKWEIMEEVGNYLDDPYDHENDFGDWTDIKRIKTFCKTFQINENELAYYYARGLSESGYCLAYVINEEMILVIE